MISYTVELQNGNPLDSTIMTFDSLTRSLNLLLTANTAKVGVYTLKYSYFFNGFFQLSDLFTVEIIGGCYSATINGATPASPINFDIS